MLDGAMDRTDGVAAVFRHFGFGLIQFSKRILGAGHFAVPGFFRRDKAIVLRAIETYAGWLFGGESLRHLPADVDGNGWVAAGAGVIEISPEPPISFDFFRVTSRLPNLCGAEMRAVGVRVADALDNCQMAGIVKLFEAAHARMESDVIIHFQDLLFSQTNPGPGAMIVIVGVGNDRVKAVVAAGHLEDDQNAGIMAGCNLCGFLRSLSLEHGKGVSEEGGNGPGEGAAQYSAAKKFPTGLES